MLTENDIRLLKYYGVIRVKVATPMDQLERAKREARLKAKRDCAAKARRARGARVNQRHEDLKGMDRKSYLARYMQKAREAGKWKTKK